MREDWQERQREDVRRAAALLRMRRRPPDEVARKPQERDPDTRLPRHLR